MHNMALLKLCVMQLASTTLLVLVVFAGFSIVKDSIPPWWIWAVRHRTIPALCVAMKRPLPVT